MKCAYVKLFVIQNTNDSDIIITVISCRTRSLTYVDSFISSSFTSEHSFLNTYRSFLIRRRLSCLTSSITNYFAIADLVLTHVNYIRPPHEKFTLVISKRQNLNSQHSHPLPVCSLIIQTSSFPIHTASCTPSTANLH